MPQSGYTPIQIYSSSTPTNAPSAGNLTNDTKGSELAINIADKNLFFKDSSNVVNTVPIRQSGAASDGWLSSTDWNTFNNKQPAGAYLTSVTADSPLSGAGTSASHLVIAQATTSTSGYLSSTDWNTFNGKQAALVSGTNIKTVNGATLLGSGDLGTIGIAYGGTGLTSFTANQLHYGSFSQSANLTYDGTTLTINGSATNLYFKLSRSTSSAGVGYIYANSTDLFGVNDGSLYPFIVKQGAASSTLVVDATSNIAVGGTSQSWSNYFKVINIGGGGAYYASPAGTDAQLFLGSNNYYNGSSYARVTANPAAQYQQINGEHRWNIAATGTAGSTFTFTQAMTLFNSGGVSIGNTTDPGATNLSVTGTGKFGTTVGVGAATPAASGAGITFPATQSASSDANTLDDYEEGTWTPTDASGASLSFTSVAGYYVKIGKYVIASAQLTFPVTANGSNAMIGSLPFACGADGTRTAFISYNNAGATAMNFTGASTTSLYISNSSGTLFSNLGCSGKVFYFAASYIVA